VITERRGLLRTKRDPRALRAHDRQGRSEPVALARATFRSCDRRSGRNPLEHPNGFESSIITRPSETGGLQRCAVDDFQVLHCCRPPDIEQVLRTHGSEAPALSASR